MGGGQKKTVDSKKIRNQFKNRYKNPKNLSFMSDLTIKNRR